MRYNTDDNPTNSIKAFPVYDDSGTWRNLVTTNDTSGSGAIILPKGTENERPTTGVSGTAAKGMLRYNTDSDSFEGFSGSGNGAWGAIGEVVVVVVVVPV